MPLRPFPFPLRVGTDICNVSRIRRVIAGEDGLSPQRLDRFLRRILSKPERLYFWDRFGPAHSIVEKHDAVSEYLAGRFAAKEAIRKAANNFHKDARGLHEIMILPIALGSRTEKISVAPQGLILDRNHEAESSTSPLRSASVDVNTGDLETYDGQLCEISISHDADIATAVALVPSVPHGQFGKTN